MAAISTLPHCTHRYALLISYLGTKYLGSQRQVKRGDSGSQDSVQEALEWSLEKVFVQEKCRVTASSRTDRGVHALMNCYTLPLIDFAITTEALKSTANMHLFKAKHDVVINEAILVPAEFHPRRNVVSREYIYRIAVLGNDESIMKKGLCYKPQGLLDRLPITELYKILPIPYLNYDKVLEAIDLLRGKHDFRSFMASSDYIEEDTVRDLEIDISEAKSDGFGAKDNHPYSVYNIHFKSRAFLYNQVRRMVGAILTYASYGLLKVSDIKYLIDNPSSTSWKPHIRIADPCGLYLSRINFDESAFEGSLRTHKDKTQESVTGFSHMAQVSDDSFTGVEN